MPTYTMTVVFMYTNEVNMYNIHTTRTSSAYVKSSPCLSRSQMSKIKIKIYYKHGFRPHPNILPQSHLFTVYKSLPRSQMNEFNPTSSPFNKVQVVITLRYDTIKKNTNDRPPPSCQDQLTNYALTKQQSYFQTT